jgi:hypothetical protein
VVATQIHNYIGNKHDKEGIYVNNKLISLTVIITMVPNNCGIGRLPQLHV